MNRMIGMVPGVVICSEINPVAGIGPTSKKAYPPEVALKLQMSEWYGIELRAVEFRQVVQELLEWCQLRQKQLVIRDWTHINFRSAALNDCEPSYRFTLIEELREFAELRVLGLVRDSIDVYLSTREKIECFGDDYVRYVRSLADLKVPIVRYEDLISQPERTFRIICEDLGLTYSERYRAFSENRNCTGDLQLGRLSRGFRQASIAPLPRRRVSRSKWREIERCLPLLEANRLLGYPPTYWNGTVETFSQSAGRRLRNGFEKLRRLLPST